VIRFLIISYFIEVDSKKRSTFTSNYSNTAWKFVANIQSPNIIATKIRKNIVISKLKFIEIKATGKNTKIAMP
jgi:hypothetical protein